MKGKKSLTSGVLNYTKTHVEGYGIMYWNDLEDNLDLFGVDRRKYVMGGSLLHRRPHNSSRPKR